MIEELQQQDGFPFEQVIDWDSAIVTQRLDVIIENEIQNVMVDPNVHCNQGTSQNVPENFAQNGRQIEIELQNAGLEVQIPKVNLEFDEECNWFEKTCTGSKLIRQISLLMELGAKSFVSQYRKYIIMYRKSI